MSGRGRQKKPAVSGTTADLGDAKRNEVFAPPIISRRREKSKCFLKFIHGLEDLWQISTLTR